MLEVWNRFAPNRVVGEAIKFLRTVLNSPELISWLEGLLNGVLDRQVRSVACTKPIDSSHIMPAQELAIAAQAAGIDWVKLFTTILPFILQLLEAWMNNQDGGGGDSSNPNQADFDPSSHERCQ